MLTWLVEKNIVVCGLYRSNTQEMLQRQQDIVFTVVPAVIPVYQELLENPLETTTDDVT